MTALDQVLELIKQAISVIGVLIIAIGSFKAIGLYILHWTHRSKNHVNYIRSELGNSIILGLEFMVGADIIESVVEPTYYSLGLLAILVIIRTVLSYFLNKELEALSTEQREKLD